jgi:hypothetical protein
MPEEYHLTSPAPDSAAIEDKLDFHQGATRTAAHRKEGAGTTLLAMITGTALVLVGIESLFR